MLVVRGVVLVRSHAGLEFWFVLICAYFVCVVMSLFVLGCQSCGWVCGRMVLEVWFGLVRAYYLCRA